MISLKISELETNLPSILNISKQEVTGLEALKALFGLYHADCFYKAVNDEVFTLVNFTHINKSIILRLGVGSSFTQGLANGLSKVLMANMKQTDSKYKYQEAVKEIYEALENNYEQLFDFYAEKFKDFVFMVLDYSPSSYNYAYGCTDEVFMNKLMGIFTSVMKYKPCLDLVRGPNQQAIILASKNAFEKSALNEKIEKEFGILNDTLPHLKIFITINNLIKNEKIERFNTLCAPVEYSERLYMIKRQVNHRLNKVQNDDFSVLEQSNYKINQNAEVIYTDKEKILTKGDLNYA